MSTTYYAILTNVGVTRLAEAVGSSTPLVFAHVAVGDGNGAPITPGATMTALVNERARVVVNNVEVSPDEPDTVRVEGLIPAGTGGFTIREAGLYNDADELIAIASYPPIYKPIPGTDGVSVDEYIRILIDYSNPTYAMALIVDPDVIMATRRYVDIGDAAERAHSDAADAALQAQIVVIDDQIDGIDGALDTINSSIDTLNIEMAANTAADLLRMGVGYFGNGDEGDLTASSGTTTLTRDTSYRNVTLTGTAKIDANGYLLRVARTLTVGATAGDTCRIVSQAQDGGAGTLGAGGTAGSTANRGTVNNGGDGAIGGAAGVNGMTGSSTSNSIGGNAGAGGDSNSQVGGVAGAAPSPVAAAGRWTSLFSMQTSQLMSRLGVASLEGGAGGGSGAGSDLSDGNGGGGGGGGGILNVAVNRLVVVQTGEVFRARGAAGGAGYNGGGAGHRGGGGGGGGGGAIQATIGTYVIPSGVIGDYFSVIGGTGGAAGGAGASPGASGGPGNTILCVLKDL